MKVLIKIRNSPEQRFLVELTGKKLIKEIKHLTGKGNNSKAIVTVLSKGKFQGELTQDEAANAGAELILTEENARYDLV
jgi:hypothetical protein